MAVRGAAGGSTSMSGHWWRRVLDPDAHALLGLLGAGTVLFGLAPMVAPGWFGRLFALPVDSDSRLLVMVRSVGIRDATIGVGLVAAALRRRGYAPWLTARIVADAGDTVAVALAVGAGARQPRFLALGGLALGATITGLVLRRLAPDSDPEPRLPAIRAWG